MNNDQRIIHTLKDHYPKLQAIYRFGSYGTDRQWPDSDLDIALLLPVLEAKQQGSLAMSAARFALEAQFKCAVDLINLRQVSTVFQQEITTSGRVIASPDTNAMQTFEMYVLSFYQKLNEERREILAEFYASKRAYAV